ncbi:hypothetical protein J437_LFUL017059, partial [Ladona fulva]
ESLKITSKLTEDVNRWLDEETDSSEEEIDLHDDDLSGDDSWKDENNCENKSDGEEDEGENEGPILMTETDITSEYNGWVYVIELEKSSHPHAWFNRSKKVPPMALDEIRRFIGICILHGNLGFLSIHKAVSYDPLYCKNFQKAFYQDEALSLDESLLLLCGCLFCRQFMKEKKAKYGIKCFELCSSDGYILNVEIYKSKNVSEGKFNMETLVTNLIKPYLNKGVYMDSFYYSLHLSKSLYTTRTLHSNRQHSKNFVAEKLKQGDYKWNR